jgi:hypothetical protein
MSEDAASHESEADRLSVTWNGGRSMATEGMLRMRLPGGA